jgi:hypothetical protein
LSRHATGSGHGKPSCCALISCKGGQEHEPLFDVSKIAGLEVLDEMFDRPGPNYKRDESTMETIFAQL